MQNTDVREWLKKVYPEAQHFYIGKVDNSKEKAVGVFTREGKREVPIGGLINKKSRKYDCEILIHWNKSAKETDEAAQRLYDYISESLGEFINAQYASYLQLADDYPIDVGTDENGVYERVIRVIFHY